MFLSRMMMAQPVGAGFSFTHSVTLATGAANIVGMSVPGGFGSISPTTFEGATFEFFKTDGTWLEDNLAIVIRFGGTTFGTNHIEVEMDGVAGAYEFTDISDFRYGALNTVPANETLHAAMIAASGTTVDFRFTLIAG